MFSREQDLAKMQVLDVASNKTERVTYLAEKHLSCKYSELYRDDFRKTQKSTNTSNLFECFQGNSNRIILLLS